MLFRICMSFFNLLVENTNAGTTESTNDVIDPLYKALDIILPTVLGVVLLSGTLYAVAIGVQYSRAIDAKARALAKTKLVNAVIGFGIVLVLVAVLYAIRGSVVAFIRH